MRMVMIMVMMEEDYDKANMGNWKKNVQFYAIVTKFLQG